MGDWNIDVTGAMRTGWGMSEDIADRREENRKIRQDMNDRADADRAGQMLQAQMQETSRPLAEMQQRYEVAKDRTLEAYKDGEGEFDKKIYKAAMDQWKADFVQAGKAARAQQIDLSMQFIAGAGGNPHKQKMANAIATNMNATMMQESNAIQEQAAFEANQDRDADRAATLAQHQASEAGATTRARLGRESQERIATEGAGVDMAGIQARRDMNTEGIEAQSERLATTIGGQKDIAQLQADTSTGIAALNVGERYAGQQTQKDIAAMQQEGMGARQAVQIDSDEFKQGRQIKHEQRQKTQDVEAAKNRQKAQGKIDERLLGKKITAQQEDSKAARALQREEMEKTFDFRWGDLAQQRDLTEAQIEQKDRALGAGLRQFYDGLSSDEMRTRNSEAAKDRRFGIEIGLQQRSLDYQERAGDREHEQMVANQWVENTTTLLSAGFSKEESGVLLGPEPGGSKSAQERADKNREKMIVNGLKVGIPEVDTLDYISDMEAYSQIGDKDSVAAQQVFARVKAFRVRKETANLIEEIRDARDMTRDEMVSHIDGGLEDVFGGEWENGALIAGSDRKSTAGSSLGGWVVGVLTAPQTLSKVAANFGNEVGRGMDDASGGAIGDALRNIALAPFGLAAFGPLSDALAGVESEDISEDSENVIALVNKAADGNATPKELELLKKIKEQLGGKNARGSTPRSLSGYEPGR